MPSVRLSWEATEMRFARFSILMTGQSENSRRGSRAATRDHKKNHDRSPDHCLFRNVSDQLHGALSLPSPSPLTTRASFSAHLTRCGCGMPRLGLSCRCSKATSIMSYPSPSPLMARASCPAHMTTQCGCGMP